MPNNTDEEHPDIPLDNKSEKPTNEIIPSPNKEAINPNKEIENMEVHHHAHDPAAPHHKKNWKNYFWEFLMLFLAVFCGFLAEYQLEHKIERDRETEYIHSLMNDLKTDTMKLNNNLKIYKRLHLAQDTAMEKLSSIKNGFDERFLNNFDAFNYFPDFIYTDATIQQLKNSGGFRLIRNQKVVDSIMSYDAIVKRALINENALVTFSYKTADFSSKVFNIFTMTQQIKKGKTLKQLNDEGFKILLISDETILSQFGNQLFYHYHLSKAVAGNMQDVKTKAEGLLMFLKKAYDVK